MSVIHDGTGGDVNRDLLEIHDGPLTKSLRETDGKRIALPPATAYQRIGNSWPSDPSSSSRRSGRTIGRRELEKVCGTVEGREHHGERPTLVLGKRSYEK